MTQGCPITVFGDSPPEARQGKRVKSDRSSPVSDRLGKPAKWLKALKRDKRATHLGKQVGRKGEKNDLVVIRLAVTVSWMRAVGAAIFPSPLVLP